jgi:hypothetical protein
MSKPGCLRPALELEPGMEDAQFNRDLVEQMKQQNQGEGPEG